MNKRKKTAIGASIVGSMLLGGAIGASFITSASAATDTPSGTSTSAPDDRSGPGDHDGGARPDRDESTGGHVGANGRAEARLTGDTAARVTAAVTAKYPDAEIQRVENDAEGGAYEAHIIQSDGTRATVKLDKSFTITSTEIGHGHGHGPGHDDDNNNNDDADDTGDTDSGS